jgi:hypothetical protein
MKKAPTSHVGKRVARNARALPEFEEHRIAGRHPLEYHAKELAGRG